LLSAPSRMASRQERRKAERDAAKRAPPGQAGATAAAAAAANVNPRNPVGDWTTQAEDPDALLRAMGGNIVRQRAAEGDRQGLTLVHVRAQLEQLQDTFMS